MLSGCLLDDRHQVEGQPWPCVPIVLGPFPFLTTCVARRATSPLRVGDEVELVGMAPDKECEHEMFVLMPWEQDTLAVPLSQLEVIHGDEQTQQAVQDWHYWTARGYQL